MTKSREYIQLKVSETLSKDVGRAFARMDPEDMAKLQVNTGDVVQIQGKRASVCKLMPAYKEVRGQSRIQLDGLSRENAGVGLDDSVTVRRAIARETDANFFSVSGPEVIHKLYGESEAHLRSIFEDATRNGPSTIFLDEIDAIAPNARIPWATLRSAWWRSFLP